MGSPGDFIYPFVVPCCGLVPPLLVLGIALWAWARRVEIDALDVGPPAPAFSGTIGYVGPRPRRTRQTVVRPPFRWVAGIAVGLYASANVAWFGYLMWGHRTRTTTLLLIDAKTGRPNVVAAGDVYVDCPAPWSTTTVSYPAPGTVRVEWTHPCDIEFSHVNWASQTSHDVTLASVDDASPRTITVPLAP